MTLSVHKNTTLDTGHDDIQRLRLAFAAETSGSIMW